MPFSQTLLPEFEAEMKNTRKLLECLPDGKFNYQPHPKSMTLSHLATHVAQIPGWVKSVLDLDVLDLDPEMKYPIVASRAETLEMFDRGVADAREKIRTASDDQWKATWTLKVGGTPHISKPRAEIMRNEIMNHLIHHRAQLGVYLRLNDVAIPGMYGPSADDPKLGAAQAA